MKEKKTVASIVGARPQFVKVAPLSKKIRGVYHEVLIHTGQHYDIQMSDVFFRELEIPEPDYNLEIGSGNHGEQTGKMLSAIEKMLLKTNPDIVLTFGDTNSTLAGALAAAKLCIPSAHVEAGLRSFNRKMPEEINRIVADRLADLLFVPTKTGVSNLKSEGITNNVFLVGDIMYDAVLKAINVARKKSGIIKKLKLKEKEYMLATVHRADNTTETERLSGIVEGLTATDEKIVFPTHPRVHKALRQAGLLKKLEGSKNVIVSEPLGYFDFLLLEENAKKILTDSGGVQKEAFFLKVPCITLRDETEWVETIETGWNILVGADKDRIISAIEDFEPPSGKQENLFGEGNAAHHIVEHMTNFLK